MHVSSLCSLSPAHVKLHSMLIYIAANLCESRQFQQNTKPDKRRGKDLIVHFHGPGHGRWWMGSHYLQQDIKVLLIVQDETPKAPKPRAFRSSHMKHLYCFSCPNRNSFFCCTDFQRLAPTLTNIEIISLFLIKRIFISFTFYFWIDQLFLFDVRKQEGDVYSKLWLLILQCKII